MSHEQSIGIEMDGRYFNLPTVYNGQKVSERDAVELFRQGKIRPLGQYSTQIEADREAVKRSQSHKGAHMAEGPGEDIVKSVVENIGVMPAVQGAGKMGGSLLDLLSRLISGAQGAGGRMMAPPPPPPPAVGQQAQQGADPLQGMQGGGGAGNFLTLLMQLLQQGGRK